MDRREFLAGSLSGVGSCMSDLLRPRIAAKPRYGWDPGATYPTKADLYVAIGGDDRAPGTIDRPLATIQTAVNRLSALGRGTLAVRGGVYREAVRFPSRTGTVAGPITIHRYGNEHVTISAANIVSGWRLCSAAEARERGIAFAPVYVLRLASTLLEHGSIYALNLHEAGKWLSIATHRADLDGIDHASDASRFFDAVPELDESQRILGFVDPRLKRLTAGELRDARVLIFRWPNWVSSTTIESFDPTTGHIRLVDKIFRAAPSGRKVDFRYALQNVANMVQPGRWIARRTDSGFIDIYVAPIDAKNLQDKMEISVRGVCMDTSRSSNVHVKGIEFIRASGDDPNNGIAVRHVAYNLAGDRQRSISLEHCRVAETLSPTLGQGAIFIQSVNDVAMRAVTIHEARGSFGLAIRNCSGVTLKNMHLSKISHSAGRFFGVKSFIFSFSLVENSCFDAHANKFNFYEGSDTVLVYGVRTRNTGGYVTYQKASRIHFAFCEFDIAPSSYGRALVSQNYPQNDGKGGVDGSGDPESGGTFWYWNLNLATGADATGSLALGPKGSSQVHAFHNSILRGGGYHDIYSKGADKEKERRSHNICTTLAWWQTASSGWRPGPEEQVRPASTRQLRAGLDMRENICAKIAPLFPDFVDWNLDIDGNTVDWNHPPIGAHAV